VYLSTLQLVARRFWKLKWKVGMVYRFPSCFSGFQPEVRVSNMVEIVIAGTDMVVSVFVVVRFVGPLELFFFSLASRGVSKILIIPSLRRRGVSYPISSRCSLHLHIRTPQLSSSYRKRRVKGRMVCLFPVFRLRERDWKSVSAFRTNFSLG
jgi:hypothetical protein